MGPEATSDLYMKIIRLFQRRYEARYDADYPKIFIYNLPLPDVVSKTSTVRPLLTEAIKKLQMAGADFVVIPCNTADCILKEAEINIKIPLISIVDETTRYIQSAKYRKVGLISTFLTIKTGVYLRALNGFGTQLIEPTDLEQEKVTRIILNILGGNKCSKDRDSVNEIIRRMALDGAEAVILGCTELPLITTQNATGVELIDTTLILAEAAVRKARGE